ncbi:MAG: ABC transporter substrate-binding protein [Thermodesulfobacteriota bacterium]
MRIRLHRIPGICIAPQYVAEELRKAEGFTDVQYVADERADPGPLLAAGRTDIGMTFVAPLLVQLDAGLPLVLLAGIHVGCFELFGNERVRAIRDLKGRRVGVPVLGSAHHVFLAAMAAYVGLDPRKDIDWVVHTVADSIGLLADGQIDALVGFPPVPQELRAKKIGHVVVNSTLDRPWSQYFCCIVVSSREFMQKHPVATKRALCAILKATDICGRESEQVARLLVDRGYTQHHNYALQALKEIPYGKWREYNPEDTMRFYALRLHEAGMIKSTPQKIIAEGTDWRFWNKLKKEVQG